MEQAVIKALAEASGVLWGVPLIVLLLGTGIYLTIALRGLQLRFLVSALRIAFTKHPEEERSEGDISHFQALMTALSATVGSGNIAGVATAIAAGGPGALFWMWVTGFVGMATKYSEAILAIKYREVDRLGTMSGGPMYYISKGLGVKWLATLFAVFTAISAFGIGNMVQSNSVADAVRSAFNVPVWVSGAVMCAFTGLVVLGGIRAIARVTSVIVPFMIIFYFAGAFICILQNIENIPKALYLIIYHAFTPTAAAGGFLGATVHETVRMGIARGIFSNESGLGSSPIAAAAAKTKNPVRQALVSMTQTFIDTIVVCSLTGLVIVSTGVWTTEKTGAALTAAAFQMSLPGEIGSYVVALSLVFFAYSSILGWCYYGEKAIEYVFKEASVVPYRVFFTVFVMLGSIVKLEVVWLFADVMNALMAFPNLVGLIGLTGVVVYETRKYIRCDPLLRRRSSQ
jgi:AGCS family alanine or glycine:cation symporter